MSVEVGTLTPAEYEQFCADRLEALGWRSHRTPGSGDQGCDVIAEKDGVRLVLQCKLYSGPVGNAAVQEVLAGREYEQADVAAVVSNSTFTRSAQQLAQNARVFLLHHDELADLDRFLAGADCSGNTNVGEQLA